MERIRIGERGEPQPMMGSYTANVHHSRLTIENLTIAGADDFGVPQRFRVRQEKTGQYLNTTNGFLSHKRIARGNESNNIHQKSRLETDFTTELSNKTKI
uniref:Uncharacterized protein n=1 Tax=Spongospora subterranea TaxID=70186 RepID=A0A0H5QR61_9EUKA|eukprot:CRZ03966.1 hypothetical protein [Spongospora subterranea]